MPCHITEKSPARRERVGSKPQTKFIAKVLMHPFECPAIIIARNTSSERFLSLPFPRKQDNSGRVRALFDVLTDFLILPTPTIMRKLMRNICVLNFLSPKGGITVAFRRMGVNWMCGVRVPDRRHIPCMDTAFLPIGKFPRPKRTTEPVLA